jgi:hypothetical protein
MFYLQVNELIYHAVAQQMCAHYTYLQIKYLACHIVSRQIRALYTYMYLQVN